MARRIEIFKKRRQASIHHRRFTNMFYFRVVGDNGEIIAQSEGYTQKHNVLSLVGKYFPGWEVNDSST